MSVPTALAAIVHEPSPATNEEIAKQRAQTVQGLLVGNGVAADRIVLDKPVLTTGDGSPDEARRVEVLIE